jgi:dsDNA-specific endonuclease/ATPase MutS2
MIVADSRTLEALDFAGVRDRVVSATRTQRGRALASDLLPHSDFDVVRREQLRTEAMRSLAASADVTIMPAVETVALTEAANVGQTLGPSELRAIGDTLAAAAAAYKAGREHPD